MLGKRRIMLRPLVFIVCIFAISEAVPWYSERTVRYNPNVDSDKNDVQPSRGIQRTRGVQESRGDLETVNDESLKSHVTDDRSRGGNSGGNFQGNDEYQRGYQGYRREYQDADRDQGFDEEENRDVQGGRGRKGDRVDNSYPGPRGQNSDSDALNQPDVDKDNGGRWGNRRQWNRWISRHREYRHRNRYPDDYDYYGRDDYDDSDENSDEAGYYGNNRRNINRAQNRNINRYEINRQQNSDNSTMKTHAIDTSQEEDQSAAGVDHNSNDNAGDGEMQNNNQENDGRQNHGNRRYRPRNDACKDCTTYNNIGNGRGNRNIVHLIRK